MTDKPVFQEQDNAELRQRRRLLAAGLGVVAAAAGAGWYWRNELPHSASAKPAEDLWQLRFAQPGGGQLAMAALRGKPLVLNFWASWCAPCVREMPELDRFQRSEGVRGLQVVGLAIDNEAAVVQFLGRVRVGFPVALAGQSGTDLMRRLGNDKGGLPFTVLFDRNGNAVQRHLGEISYAQLEKWAQSIN